MNPLRSRTLLASAILLAGCAGAPNTGRAGLAEVACSQLSFRVEGRIQQTLCLTGTDSSSTGIGLTEAFIGEYTDVSLIIFRVTMRQGFAPPVRSHGQLAGMTSSQPEMKIKDWGPEQQAGGYRYNLVTFAADNSTGTCIVFTREERPQGSGFGLEMVGFYCPRDDGVVVNEGTAATLFRDIVDN
jgi:hypothetical protein